MTQDHRVHDRAKSLSLLLGRLTLEGKRALMLLAEDVNSTGGVNGRRVRAFKNAPPTLRDLYASGRSDLPFIVYEDERYTYAEVHAQVRALAHLLRETHGVREGDRVAIAMRNYPEWVLSFAAITSISSAGRGRLPNEAQRKKMEEYWKALAG